MTDKNDLIKAKNISVGDHVLFAVPKPPDKTESAHGVVERIERSGKVKLPGTNETEEASSENPVAVIRVYATSESGKRTRTDRRVVKPFSSLRVSSEPIEDEKMYDKEEEKMYHKEKKKVKKEVTSPSDMFSTKEEAVARSKEIGCSGTHTLDKDGKTMFMPCSTHEIYDEMVNKEDEEMEKVSTSRLKELADEYNKNKTGDKRITVGALRQVYNRGIGAYRSNPSSVRGSVSSPEQWAMGRVNAFMRGLRGRFPRKPFDLDLFPKGHPRSTRKSLFDSMDDIKDLLVKVESWEGKPLYDMLSEDEKAFADSLLKLSEEIGPLDQSEGIWIGYEDGSSNENASIGVKCGNCALHKSSIACAIISQKIEEEGACRLAVIPDGYVQGYDDMEDDMFEMFKSDDQEDAWDNDLQKCWVGYRQDGMKEKDGRMVPNCVPVSKSDSTGDVEKADIDLTPTSGMKSAAARALAWKKEGKRGGTRVGLARANQIVNGTKLSESTVARMYSFFSRHEVDKQATGFSSGEEGFPSPGRVAWDLWGGDAGFSWSTAKWNSIKNSRENKAYHEDIKKSFWSGSAFELKK